MEGVPAGRELDLLLVHLPVGVPPGQPDPQRTLHITQSNVDVGAALAGVPAAAVEVVDERAAVRGRHLHLRAVHRGARRRCRAPGSTPVPPAGI